MKAPRLAAQARARLDERFKEIGPSARFSPPVRGWIYPFRELFETFRVGLFVTLAAVPAAWIVWSFLTRDRGKYRFRISAYAHQSEKPVLFHVNGGTNNLGEEPYLIGYFEAPSGKPTVVEVDLSSLRMVAIC